MQRRKKIGGMLDRRIGENDPAMTPEEKALQRFVKEKQRGNNKGSLFDLDEDEDSAELTHAGKSLSFDKRLDDFDEANLEDSKGDQATELLHQRPAKRRKLSDVDALEEHSSDEVDPIQSGPPKTKKEVMDEIIAKSKLHKHERQQAKEDDDEIRAELDKGLPDLIALMRGNAKPPTQIPQESVAPNAGMNPDRMALLNGKDRSQADKEYDERLRQMAADQRAKPTVRTLTEEEKLYQDAQRLKDLETNRLRRMQGEPEVSDSDVAIDSREIDGVGRTDPDEENTFGLGSGLLGQSQRPDLGVEDEDEFVIDDDVVINASEVDVSDPGSEGPVEEPSDGDDEEFVQRLLSKEDASRQGLVFSKDKEGMLKANEPSGNLAYTYKCPQTHEELLSVTKDVLIEDLPTVIQRIRALYHPKLASENKAKLGNFASVLVDHISYLVNQSENPPFSVLEAVIRHVHSLAKQFPEHIGRAFRLHLKAIHEQRPTGLVPGDIIILTAIASTFPTSDHFHQVVTPAMLCMARYLGQKIPGSLNDLVTGTYIVTLCLQYQQISRRYIPEAVNYVLNALWALAPVKSKQITAPFPHHTLPDGLRLQHKPEKSSKVRQLRFWDILPSGNSNDEDNEILKLSLLNTLLDIIDGMTVTWAEHSAFCEVFDPVYTALRFIEGKPCLSRMNEETRAKIQKVSTNVHNQLQQSLSTRKPLRLHNHRPLAIKTSIPKFEDSYNPDKHYDPNRDRADVSKLKAEHKRERKGAMRELRKDANFMARESLREKKEKDSAYEKKYKRLVAEIQGEEGREAKSYEREKRLRKGKR